MPKKETKTQPELKTEAGTVVCWYCHQPGMKQVKDAKPGWRQCPVCGATDCIEAKEGS